MILQVYMQLKRHQTHICYAIIIFRLILLQCYTVTLWHSPLCSGEGPSVGEQEGKLLVSRGGAPKRKTENKFFYQNKLQKLPPSCHGACVEKSLVCGK